MRCFGKASSWACDPISLNLSWPEAEGTPHAPKHKVKEEVPLSNIKRRSDLAVIWTTECAARALTYSTFTWLTFVAKSQIRQKKYYLSICTSVPQFQVYLFEKVKSRDFGQAWSLILCCQALPIGAGVPAVAGLEAAVTGAGDIFCGMALVVAGAVVFGANFLRRNMGSTGRKPRDEAMTCHVKDVTKPRKSCFFFQQLFLDINYIVLERVALLHMNLFHCLRRQKLEM